MTIGGRIKQARKASNLSLRKLADKIGVSAMAISKYERDQDVPSSGVLLRLSQALKVKVAGQHPGNRAGDRGGTRIVLSRTRHGRAS